MSSRANAADVIRAATPVDVDGVAETIALAFVDDPVWGVALGRPDGSTAHHLPFWRSFVEGAVRYSTVFVCGDAAAVAVWIPPGGSELSEAGEAAVEGLLAASLEPATRTAMTLLWDRFATNHPIGEPHAYLSLLATHPDHRGRGVGQRLLAENLGRWDDVGVPAYLESTNPANDHRYERAGFARIGGFRSVLNDAPISTMWRPISGR